MESQDAQRRSGSQRPTRQLGGLFDQVFAVVKAEKHPAGAQGLGEPIGRVHGGVLSPIPKTVMTESADERVLPSPGASRSTSQTPSGKASADRAALSRRAASCSRHCPRGIPRRHGNASSHPQSVPWGRINLRPARLPGRSPAQARPSGDAKRPNSDALMGIFLACSRDRSLEAPVMRDRPMPLDASR
jgi:hypothetical protein